MQYEKQFCTAGKLHSSSVTCCFEIRVPESADDHTGCLRMNKIPRINK